MRIVASMVLLAGACVVLTTVGPEGMRIWGGDVPASLPHGSSPTNGPGASGQRAPDPRPNSTSVSPRGGTRRNEASVFLPASTGSRPGRILVDPASTSTADGTSRPERPPSAARDGAATLRRDERFDLAPTLSVAHLVEDLRDDDVRWNASAAGKELSARFGDPETAAEVKLQLERALHTRDAQQWRIAAGLLISDGRYARGGGEEPPEMLLDRTVQLLGGWTCGQDARWIRGEPSDERTAAFVVEHVDLLEERLVYQLSSRPVGEKFIFAYVLGVAGKQHLADLVVPVLVDHLRDNYVRDDALMGMEALYRLGGEAIPGLQAAAPGADAQQRACIELLIREITDPARTAEQRAARAHLNVVTWKCDDPVQSWHYVARFRR